MHRPPWWSLKRYENQLEITDVIIDYDPETLARLPVRKADAIEKLRRAGNPCSALRIVEGLPDRNGILDPDAVDHLFLVVHGELQRLWEEFLQGQRLVAYLTPIIQALRLRAPGRVIRVVDIGCGCGYLLRWLAAQHLFDEDVVLLGTDYNQALVHFAQSLSEREGLRCHFVAANAFALREKADIYLSTAVLHHFRGDDLSSFFEAQATTKPMAFLHFDIQPSWAAPFGAWLFHRARMREAISRHDGVLSALRAHPGKTLLHTAQRAMPTYTIAHRDPFLWYFPLIRTMQTLIGVHPSIVADVPATLFGDTHT